MSLYIVTLSKTVVIEAMDETDAYDAAISERHEIFMDSDPDIDVGSEITSLEQLPGEWDGMCLPYGGDGRTRLQDLLLAAGSAK